jgi:hypothetical protein
MPELQPFLLTIYKKGMICKETPKQNRVFRPKIGMKTIFRAIVFCVTLFLYGCGESLVDSRYVFVLPKLPDAWETMLGSADWQITWVNDRGKNEAITIAGNRNITVSLHPTRISAVSALPFWPDKGIRPGVFRQAGAIFPFDVSGTTLVASWQGGVDAHVFGELALLAGRAGQGGDEAEAASASRAAVLRLPQNFNWPRFRLLFNDPSLNEEVRADPWLADWSGIAAKIAQSGFDKRRLVPKARSSMNIPVGPGPWIGTSPFAAPLVFEGIPVFPVTIAAGTWVSAEGILRCNTQTWILYKK